MELRNEISSLPFIEELDRLKSVLRRTMTFDASRLENTAEHSWHLAMAVLVSADLSNEPIVLEQAVKMALTHDIVEIDAGDTFLYDGGANADKTDRERRAAERLFGLLPANIDNDLRDLWERYERQECAESKFVMAFDRFLPLTANFKTQGRSWKKHGIKKNQVMQLNEKIAKGSRKLWQYAEAMINEAVKLGYLPTE